MLRPALSPGLNEVSVWLSWWRRLGLAAVAAAALLFLVGCSKSPEPPLRVATIPWPGYESMHLAQSLGYFNATQIRLVELLNNSQCSLALRNRTVDAGLMTLDEALVLRQDGVDLRIIAVVDISNGADVVMARPEIATLLDLRGKRIGVDRSAIGAVMLDAMLTAGGLTVGELRLVDMPVNEHEAAYRAGQVDAVVTFEPVRTTLLKQGAHILFDSSHIPGRIVDVLVVRTEIMAEHSLDLTALVAAHFRALGFLSSQPREAAIRIAPFLGVTPDEVLPQFDGLKLPPLAENQVLLAGASPALIPRATELADLMLRRQLLSRAVALDHLVEARYLPPVQP